MTGAAMDVVVWNLDPRNRPDLEVEIEIEYQPGELPGMHYARRCAELEVEFELVFGHELPEAIVDMTADALLDDDDDWAPIRDLPPDDYARAYQQAAARPLRRKLLERSLWLA
ncbi:MAG TPA: hypothetical protein VMJ10_07740 [Kofleriaceae bacterium]|nr:hypothetical protein [Kofleriaceae bacterium]